MHSKLWNDEKVKYNECLFSEEIFFYIIYYEWKYTINHFFPKKNLRKKINEINRTPTNKTKQKQKEDKMGLYNNKSKYLCLCVYMYGVEGRRATAYIFVKEPELTSILFHLRFETGSLMVPGDHCLTPLAGQWVPKVFLCAFPILITKWLTSVLLRWALET